MKKAMSDQAHVRLRARRERAIERARHNAEVSYAREIVAQTGCTRSEALRIAYDQVSEDLDRARDDQLEAALERAALAELE